MANVKKKQTREERLEKKRQAEKLRYLVLIKFKKMEKSSGPHHYKFKNSVK